MACSCGIQVQCPAHAAAHLSVYARFSVVYSMNSEVGASAGSYTQSATFDLVVILCFR